MATFEGDADVPAFLDFDEEFVVSSEPYLYEPEYTDEELMEMDAQSFIVTIFKCTLNHHVA